MTDSSDTTWTSTSDAALIKALGSFIKFHRLQQNKTQVQLSREAGIARSTLCLFEKGENTSLLVFIQLLRALKQLQQLQAFQVTRRISPIQLAKLEKSERQRARNNSDKESKPKSDW